MKPTLIQIPSHGDYSFRISTEFVPYFHNPFHYHEEFELTYILQSSGTRFVGDSIEPFEVDDLVLVGSNLPHCWKNDTPYFKEGSKLKAQAIIVQFKKNFGGNLLDLFELRHVKKLLEDASKGIKFLDEIKPEIKLMLLDLVKMKGAKRITKLLELLEFMAITKKKKLLSKSHNSININSNNLERLNTIFEYSIDNLKKDITLNEISSYVHLSPNAFCRYFKKHTQKTYREFINELRISAICKEFHETNKSIADIAYLNGFNNLSHFIRIFKKVKGLKPSDYRKQIGDS